MSYWPRVSAPTPLDRNRRLIQPRRGQRTVRADDSRVRYWRVRWIAPGQSRERRKSFPTRREADRLYEDLLVAKREGWPADPATGLPITPAQQAAAAAGPTFKEYVYETFLPARRPGWKPKTRAMHETNLAMAVKWLCDEAGQSIRLRDLTTDHLQELVNRRAYTYARYSPTQGVVESYEHGKVSVSPATLRGFWITVGAVLRSAQRRTPPLIDMPGPAVGVVMPAGGPDKREWGLELEDLEAIAAVIDPHFQLPVLLRGLTAIRPEELRPLDVGDIDTERWLLTLRKTQTAVGRRFTDDGTSYTSGPLKHRKPGETRAVPIPDHAWLRRLLGERVRSADSHEPLVTMKRGGRADWGNFQARYWRPVVDRLFPEGHALHSITFYELRHCALNLWADAGVSESTASAWAGVSPEVIVAHYRRRRGRAEEAARERLDSVLRDRPDGGAPPTGADEAEVEAA